MHLVMNKTIKVCQSVVTQLRYIVPEINALLNSTHDQIGTKFIPIIFHKNIPVCAMNTIKPPNALQVRTYF